MDLNHIRQNIYIYQLGEYWLLHSYIIMLFVIPRYFSIPQRIEKGITTQLYNKWIMFSYVVSSRNQISLKCDHK